MLKQLRFTSCVQWGSFQKPLPKNDMGIYLLAHFGKAPAGAANPETSGLFTSERVGPHFGNDGKVPRNQLSLPLKLVSITAGEPT